MSTPATTTENAAPAIVVDEAAKAASGKVTVPVATTMPEPPASTAVTTESADVASEAAVEGSAVATQPSPTPAMNAQETPSIKDDGEWHVYRGDGTELTAEEKEELKNSAVKGLKCCGILGAICCWPCTLFVGCCLLCEKCCPSESTKEAKEAEEAAKQEEKAKAKAKQ